MEIVLVAQDDFSKLKSENTLMDLFLFNPLTDEILYEDSSIILINHDGAEVRCRAELHDIAEVNGYTVHTWMQKGDNGGYYRVWVIDNWAHEKWHPSADELYYYLKYHISDCTLWIDHEAEYPCRHLIEEAERLGIEVITWDSGLRELNKKVNKQIQAA